MSETPQPRLPADGARRQAIGSAVPALCGEMPDLAPAFALGALDGEEALAVERHRQTCPLCAHLVDEAERTAALLPYLVPARAPSPDVRAALFTRIAHVQQQRANPTVSRASGPVPSPPTSLPATNRSADEERVARVARRRLRLPAPVIGARRDRSAASGAAGAAEPPRGASWGSRPGPILPLATTVPLMLILAVVGGWAMAQYNRANEAATYQDLWGTMGSLLSSESGTVFDLERSAGAPASATGRIIAELDAEHALVMVWGLERSNPEVSYQIWVERDGGWLAAGELDVDERGNGREMVDLAGRLRECQRVVVTAETVDAEGQRNSVELLSTQIIPAGPASGGDGTEGAQPIGSDGLDVELFSAPDRGR